MDVGPVSDSAIERLWFHLEDAKKDMFPERAQPPVWKYLGASKILEDTQAMKARAFEHARWRSSQFYVHDLEFQCVLHKMKEDLTAFCRSSAATTELGQLAECFSQHTTTRPEMFLNAMHSKALKVTELKQEGKDALHRE